MRNFSKTMPQFDRVRFLLALLLTLFYVQDSPGHAEEFHRPPRKPVEVASGTKGMVVCDTPLAAEIGADVLARGGNAVDAGVATAFALAVTWPEAGNIGGGGFMMVAPPDEDVVCVEYRETAPASAHKGSFVGWENHRHAKMAGVPGTVRGLALAHRKYGKLPWKELIEPSVRLAREGFVVNEYLAYSLNSILSLESMQTDPRYEEFRKVYGPKEGTYWNVGDRIVLKDLAGTLQLIAAQGASGFYAGTTTEAIVREMERGGGLISREDLKNYRANVRQPIQGRFQGYTVFGAPLPSSGGITVLMELRMLDSLNVQGDPEQYWTANQVHFLTEIMKRAFRERAAHLGDADFVEIDPRVYQAKHARKLARTIDPDKATPSEELAGSIPLSEGPYESPQTTHFSIIDADGMAVSNTYTLERRFGCWIIPEGTGFLLNNEMGDFNWYPGYTNTSGRIGTKPNLIEPGKRMLSSQSPMLVKKGDKVTLVLGTPGGRTIINTVFEILVQTLLFDRPAEQAVDGPRFHHQWLPDTLYLEDDSDGVLNAMKKKLEKKGHTVSQPEGRRQGSAQVIQVDPETGKATGVADWRRGAAARAVRE